MIVYQKGGVRYAVLDDVAKILYISVKIIIHINNKKKKIIIAPIILPTKWLYFCKGAPSLRGVLNISLHSLHIYFLSKKSKGYMNLIQVF